MKEVKKKLVHFAIKNFKNYVVNIELNKKNYGLIRFSIGLFVAL